MGVFKSLFGSREKKRPADDVEVDLFAGMTYDQQVAYAENHLSQNIIVGHLYRKENTSV